MFVYSVRASTLRFALVIVLTLGVLAALVLTGGAESVYASSDGIEIRYSGVKEEEDRITFLSQFGIAVKGEGGTSEGFTMPESLDRVLLGYNELQKAQGLDLSKYTNKRVTRYTYEVTNADYDGTVFVNLLIYRGKVIGADVSSGDPSGFVMPLTEFKTIQKAN